MIQDLIFVNEVDFINIPLSSFKKYLSPIIHLPIYKLPIFEIANLRKEFEKFFDDKELVENAHYTFIKTESTYLSYKYSVFGEFDIQVEISSHDLAMTFNGQSELATYIRRMYQNQLFNRSVKRLLIKLLSFVLPQYSHHCMYLCNFLSNLLEFRIPVLYDAKQSYYSDGCFHIFIHSYTGFLEILLTSCQKIQISRTLTELSPNCKISIKDHDSIIDDFEYCIEFITFLTVALPFKVTLNDQINYAETHQ